MMLLQTSHIKQIYMHINTLMQIRRNIIAKKFPTKGWLHEDSITEFVGLTYGIIEKAKHKTLLDYRCPLHLYIPSDLVMTLQTS